MRAVYWLTTRTEMVPPVWVDKMSSYLATGREHVTTSNVATAKLLGIDSCKSLTSNVREMAAAIYYGSRAFSASFLSRLRELVRRDSNRVLATSLFGSYDTAVFKLRAAEYESRLREYEGMSILMKTIKY